MVNVQVRNSETMSLNVEFHIAELQLIPRAVYERRNYGGPLHGDSGGALHHKLGGAGGRGGYNPPSNGHMHHQMHNGHMNYVLWRDLRGK
jgi:hypothetical protein